MSDLTASRDRLDGQGLAVVIACCALWGGNAVAVKYAVPSLPPIGCAGLRFLIALPVLAWLCLRARQPLWVGPGLIWLVALHAAFLVAQIGTFNYGTGRSLAGRASVLINVHPLIVAPLARFVLGERLGWRGILGLALAAGGVAVLLSSAFLSAGAPTLSAADPVALHGDLLGDLVVLFSSLIFGVQTIAQKLTFPRIPPATLLFSQALLAVPTFLVYSLMVEGPGAYHFNGEAVAGLVYQGLAASSLCYSLWFWLLRRYPAGRLATASFLTPVFGIGLSTLLKGEPLGWPLLIGGMLVGLGIYLVATGKLARPAPDPAVAH